jgi:hypothetical protein
MSHPSQPLPPEARAAKPTPPAPLWFAIAALGIISVLTLLGLARNPGVVLVAVFGNLILMLGLALGHRWAYVLVILFSVVGVAVAFAKSGHLGLPVLLGNATVLVPVLMSTRFFFPGEPQDGPPRIP